MGVKKNYMPSVPSEPHQVGISPPRDTIHGSISWSNAYVDENMTIDLIVNAMSSTKAVLHILQQGRNESTPNFETIDRVIKNISKDINVATKKSRTQKQK